MALQHHRVAQQRSAQIRIFKVAGEGDAVIEVCLLQIGAAQVAVVENRAAQVAVTEIKASQGCLEKFSLLQVAACMLG